MQKSYNTPVPLSLYYVAIDGLGKAQGNKEERQLPTAKYKYEATAIFPKGSPEHLQIEAELKAFWNEYCQSVNKQLPFLASCLKEETVRIEPIQYGTDGKPMRKPTGNMIFYSGSNTTYNGKTIKGVPVNDQGQPSNESKKANPALFIATYAKDANGNNKVGTDGQFIKEFKNIADQYNSPAWTEWRIGDGTKGYILGNLGVTEYQGVYRLAHWLEGIQISKLEVKGETAQPVANAVDTAEVVEVAPVAPAYEAPATPAPVATPATPVAYEPAPAPAYEPAPAVAYEPAPATPATPAVAYEPAPAVAYEPAPAPVATPATPVAYEPAPAPAYEPAPAVAYEPAPATPVAPVAPAY